VADQTTIMKTQTAESVAHSYILLTIHTPIDLTPAILLPGHSSGKVKPVLLERQGISQGPQKPLGGPCIYTSYTNTLAQCGLQAALTAPGPQTHASVNCRMLCELGSGEDKFLESFCSAIHRGPQEKPRKPSLSQSISMYQGKTNKRLGGKQ